MSRGLQKMLSYSCEEAYQMGVGPIPAREEDFDIFHGFVFSSTWMKVENPPIYPPDRSSFFFINYNVQYQRRYII